MLFCILQAKELKVFVLNYLFKIVQRTVLDEIVSPSRAKVQNNKDNFSLSVLLLIIVLYKRFRLPKLKFLSFKANPLLCVGVTWSSSWWPLRKRAGEQVKLSLLYPLLFSPPLSAFVPWFPWYAVIWKRGKVQSEQEFLRPALWEPAMTCLGLDAQEMPFNALGLATKSDMMVHYCSTLSNLITFLKSWEFWDV